MQSFVKRGRRAGPEVSRLARAGASAVVAAVAAAATWTGSTASAQQADCNAPSLDRWMYPFNGSGGARTTGPSFGALPADAAEYAADDTADDGFDDRDAQVLVGFATGGQIPAGLGAGNYDVASVRLTLTVSSNNTFAYDGTHDPLASYLPGGADADTGRPVELFGVGYRNGFTAATFGEEAAFAPGGAPAEAARSAFAADYASGSPVDVSNNLTGGAAVGDGFETDPWAVGTTAAVAAGSPVPAGTTLSFDLDLSDPDVLAYVQAGLDAGDLRFMVSSLHPAAFGGAPTYPVFFHKENTLPGAVPASLSVTLVPEPGAAGALVAAAGLFALRRRRGR